MMLEFSIANFLGGESSDKPERAVNQQHPSSTGMSPHPQLDATYCIA